MTIHIFADSSAQFLVLRGLLAPHQATASLLHSAVSIPASVDSVIVRADLSLAGNIAALKKLMPRMAKMTHRIFVVGARNRLAAVQAQALTATHVMENPIDRRALLAALGLLRTIEEPQLSIGAGSPEEVSAAGLQSLAAMFAGVQSGQPIDLGNAKHAAARIAESIAEDGFSNWLETVRHHHEGTYQHCLLVTGVSVAFGIKIGLPAIDIERLSFAAMLHDIGKASIPLAVLDKPGKLNLDERVLIETHPVHGYEALKDSPGITAEALDAVRHHHEYLDGSGYPDGLCEESITDLVRMLTISDVFAALIEDRRYKPPMPRQQAYDILCGMQGKLEGPLVNAFRPVALVA
jgi:putative nucleotidyltransferase with HDIG domain